MRIDVHVYVIPWCIAFFSWQIWFARQHCSFDQYFTTFAWVMFQVHDICRFLLFFFQNFNALPSTSSQFSCPSYSKPEFCSLKPARWWEYCQVIQPHQHVMLCGFVKLWKAMALWALFGCGYFNIWTYLDQIIDAQILPESSALGAWTLRQGVFVYISQVENPGRSRCMMFATKEWTSMITTWLPDICLPFAPQDD